MEHPTADSTAPATPSVEDRIESLLGSPEAGPEDDEPIGDDDGSDEAEDDGKEPFEVDGTEYRLPKDLKAKVSEWREGALRQSDYTTKTQELAEMRKQVATIAEAAQARQEFERGVAAEQQELASVKGQLAQFKNVDWGNLSVEDHIRLRGQLDSLKERASDLDGTLKGKAQQFAQWSEAKKAEMIAQGQKVLAQVIKGWGPEASKVVVSAAQEVGYTEAELASVFDPRFVKLAWKAAQFDKLQSSKADALNTANKAPPVMKPGVSDPRMSKQIEHMNFRKAIKGATSDSRKAELIGDRLARRFGL